MNIHMYIIYIYIYIYYVIYICVLSASPFGAPGCEARGCSPVGQVCLWMCEVSAYMVVFSILWSRSLVLLLSGPVARFIIGPKPHHSPSLDHARAPLQPASQQGDSQHQASQPASKPAAKSRGLATGSKPQYI